MSKQSSSSVLPSLTGKCADSDGEEDSNDRKKKSSLTSNDIAKGGSESADSTVWDEPSVSGALITARPPESIKSGTTFNGKPKMYT